MKKILVPTLFAMAAITSVLPAHARDTRHMLPIEDALNASDAQGKLSGDIKFYYGNQSHPKILTKLGSDVSNRKTNAFNKTAEHACNWAFLSALLALEKKAQQLGANAVVNIVSYYKKDEVSSPNEFECHDGAFVTGVALKGEFVKIAN
jgi:uncharacterized protein YbjQ (UPF0145 family)